MAKKDTKHENLEEDELIEEVQLDVPQVDESGSILSKLEKNKRLYIGGLILVIGLVAGYFYLSGEAKEANAKAMDNAELAFRNYFQDSLDLAINGTASYKGLEAIAASDEGDEAKNLARLMLGNAYMKKGEYAKGIKYLQEYDTDEELMVNASALANIGYGYEEQGKYGEAANHYIQAAEKVPNATTSPIFYMSAARCYKLANNNTQAKAMYEKVAKQYPKSQEAQAAKKYLVAFK